MNYIEKHTCIRFVERTNERNFVKIFSGTGCYSNLGRIGKEQKLSLKKKGCFVKGIIVHELIHALGYTHMHSHVNRNDHIEIKWENIKPDAIHNFDQVDPKKYDNFGTKYDLFSVMHYSKKAFSKNLKNTIVTKDKRFKNVIGQRSKLSFGDVKRINTMYNCTDLNN